MTGDRDAFVTVAVCYSLPAAVVARSALEARGVPTYATGQSFACIDWTLMVAIGGIDIRVPADCEADARALLGEGEPVPLRETSTFWARPLFWTALSVPAFFVLNLWPLWLRRLK